MSTNVEGLNKPPGAVCCCVVRFKVSLLEYIFTSVINYLPHYFYVFSTNSWFLLVIVNLVIFQHVYNKKMVHLNLNIMMP